MLVYTSALGRKAAGPIRIQVLEGWVCQGFFVEMPTSRPNRICQRLVNSYATSITGGIPIPVALRYPGTLQQVIYG